jgi:dipeptidyl aminopeptidase/acylaminoacyl peptidase
MLWQSRSLAGFNLLTPKPVEFRAADGTTPLLVRCFCPRRNDDGRRKNSLIVNPYGGPRAVGAG